MKKIYSLSNFLLLTSFLIGQNFIPNSSFESLIKCPDIETKDRNSLPTFNWVTATKEGTPDVYNMCAIEPWYGVPINRIYSYQQPHSGFGYAGIFVYDKTCQCREYIEVALISPLKKDRTYFVQFFVSPQNDYRRSQTRMTYVDAIGLNFTDTFFLKNQFMVELKSSVENMKGKLIKDTVGWTSISSCYTAKGGESYATIGNFKSDAETLVEKEDSKLSSDRAYFYIDDVSVLEFNPLPDSTILVCAGGAQTYNAAFLNGTYKWNTGSTDSVITITKSGTYTVEVSIDNCVLTDTVVVIVPPDAKNRVEILCWHPDCSGRGDTTLCQGKKIELSATAVPGQYAWSTGATTPKIMVDKTNNYAVTVTNRCGTYNDDVDITFKKCGCNVYVPTVFSPNGDGINDDLEVHFGCDFDYQVKRFQIFNRWGGRVFGIDNTNTIKWNGQMNNQALNPDTYVWFLEYTYIIDGKTKTVTESGDFTIVY